MRGGICTILLAGAMLALPAGPARSQSADWPCVQVLVPELSIGQIWPGPAAKGHDWQTDPQIAGLAIRLADQKLPLPEARRQIGDFARAQPEAERAERLALLARAVLEAVNGERADMISGLRRYARRQQALAERIAEESRGLSGLVPSRGADVPPDLADLKAARDWDLRIYEDRRAMLGQLCEQPVLMEQRAFAVARMMAENLP